MSKIGNWFHVMRENYKKKAEQKRAAQVREEAMSRLQARVQWQDIPLLRQCANTGDGRLDPWHGCKRERGTPVFYDLQRCRP